MKLEKAAATVIFAIVIVLIAYLAFSAIAAATDPIVKLIVASLPPIITIVGGFILHGLQRTRDLEAEINRKERERQSRLLLRKQEIYIEILNKIAPFVRLPDENRDTFTTALLQSWVVCSEDVVRSIYKFLEHRDAAHLDAILIEMRKDIGLEPYISNISIEDITGMSLLPNSLYLSTTRLFAIPTPKPQGGFSN